MLYCLQNYQNIVEYVLDVVFPKEQYVHALLSSWYKTYSNKDNIYSERVSIWLTSLPFLAIACQDSDERCTAWAADDECMINPIWMSENCFRACSGCDSTGPYQDTSLHSHFSERLNSVAPEKCASDFKSVIPEHMLGINFMSTSFWNCSEGNATKHLWW